MKKFKKTWIFILIILLIGILIVALSYSDETLIASTKAKEVLRIVGQTILSSSVFLGVVKTLQYTDYFKDEINEVIYTENYLKNLSIESLKEKWILLTNVLHSTTFPSLKNNLNSHLLNGIISVPKNYTHSKMKLTFEITEIGTDKRFFKLTEKSEFQINGQKESNVEFKIRTHIIKENINTDISNLRVSALHINKENKTSVLPAPSTMQLPDGNLKIELDCKFDIGNNSKIVKELETVHSLRFNGLWKAEFETFVEEGLEVWLYYDKTIFEVDLLAIGQTIKLEKDIFETKFVKYICRDLIFQNDCLILLIKYTSK